MNLALLQAFAGWLLTVALHGGVLLAAAWLVDRRLRLAPSARELIWRCALFGGVITASLQSFVPTSPSEWRLVLSAASASEPAQTPAKPNPAIADTQVPAAARVTTRSASARAAGAAASGAASDASTARPLPTVQTAAPIARLLPLLPLLILMLWLTGAILAFARLGLGLADLRRALARAKPLIAPADLDLAVLAYRAEVHVPDLYTLPGIASPFAFGRRIALPEWAPVMLDSPQLQAMLAHELAHLARRDPQWKLAVGCWRAGFWFLPFAGLAQRRLDDLAELACDAFAARHTGDAHLVAECLAACAERHVHAHTYAFAPAMAARDSTLIQRIDRLLEGTLMPTTKPGFYLRTAMAAALTASAFGLPAVSFLNPPAQAQTPPRAPAAPASADATASTHASVSITTINGLDQMRARISDSHHSLALDVDGKIEFSADESDIASLSAGGRASLEETRDGTTRRLELAERDGKLERRYFVDRHEQPFDDAGRAWLATQVPSLIRESGIGAEARVQRLYAKGGAAAVLAEIELIHSGYVRGVYLGLLVDRGALAPADLDRCIRLAGALDGDYEKQQALARIFAKQTLDPSEQLIFLQQAAQLHGDYERAELLSGILPKLGDSAEIRASWLDAATHIRGEYERSRTLQAMLTRRNLSEDELTSLLRASETMRGGYEQSQLLIAIAKRTRDTDAIAPVYAQSVQKLNGDYERSQALLALIRAGKLADRGSNAVLDATANIGASYERSQVLIALAKVMPDDAAVVARYREVASHLADYERGQAENALLR